MDLIPSATDPFCWIESVSTRDPDRLWLRDGRGTLSYAELLADIKRMAGRLIALEIKAGDRVAVQVGKSREALTLYLACLWHGAVYLPLNSDYTTSELGYFLSDAEPTVLIVGPDTAVATETKLLVLTLNTEGGGSLMDVTPADPGPRLHHGADCLAAMLYTSGTTGKPKGAMLSRGNLASSARALVEAWRFTKDDVLIHALPIFHVHGLFVAVNTVLAAGASLILVPKFEPAQIINLFESATVLMGVPTFYTRLLGSRMLTQQACAPMRLFVSGSAPLLSETHREFESVTGHAILERYGMTETMMNTSNPYDGPRLPGTVGPPLAGVSLRIVHPETGTALSDGQIGMIEVKGPNVFTGYWRAPEKTAAEFRSDGYFITGDLGKIDDQGYVHIIGRDKDLIISGGLNVYPKEVETEIDALPGVAESAVIGVTHADFGEAVVAIVVSEPDVELDPAGLLSLLQGRLARFKLPKSIQIVSELPRNSMGKVQKAVLRERYGTLFSA